MRDRNVQFPMRYRDKLTGKVLELEPLPGTVYAEGSMYCKANVLPEHVCKSLGIEHETAELKDALESVASGRYYGKLSRISASQKCGNGGESQSGFVQCRTVDSDDFHNITADESGKYSKIPIPAGAKRIQVLFSCTGAAALWGDAEGTLYKDGVSTGHKVTCKNANGITSSLTVNMDTTGDGSEYLSVFLRGSKTSGAPSDEKGNISLDYLQMEVIK